MIELAGAEHGTRLRSRRRNPRLTQDVDVTILAGVEDHDRVIALLCEKFKARVLIVHKAVAGRAVDNVDIEGVIERRGDKLDISYIRFWLREFALLLETDEVVARFEAPYQEWLEYHSK